MKDFDKAHLREQVALPERMMLVMQDADEALTAIAVAGILVGSSGTYRQVVDPEVQEVLPAVTEILEELVNQKRLRKATMDGGIHGPQIAYAKLSRPRVV